MAEISEELIEQELTHEGVTMVFVSIRYPVAALPAKKASRRINALYAHNAKALLRRIKKRVLPAAIAEYAQSLEKSVPFRPFEVTLSFAVTYNGEDILSLYRDLSYRCGGGRKTERFGDTWSVITGWPLGLDSFFPKRVKLRKLLIENAAETAVKQEKAGTHRYYEDFSRLIKKRFEPDNFYITGGGVAIYYDELSIAPAAEGIPVFVLPSEI